MKNEELVKALHICAEASDEMGCSECTVDETVDCVGKLMHHAANALEAAEKQIAKQQKQIANLYLLLNDRINEIAKLEAQIKMDEKEKE